MKIAKNDLLGLNSLIGKAVIKSVYLQKLTILETDHLK